MSIIKNLNKKNKDIPKYKKVIKPWGSEYSIYRNNISSAKLLKIKSKHKTSLHCHPNKKTAFLLVDGEVDVKIGFYETKKLKSISKLMIRPGLFHSTKNNNKKTASIIEIETPVDKDDLVRFKDNYGRENLPTKKKIKW
jgi:mannose-6-phosphate isomerase-like protein (cupin superfamily)